MTTAKKFVYSYDLAIKHFTKELESVRGSPIPKKATLSIYFNKIEDKAQYSHNSVSFFSALTRDRHFVS